MSQKLGFWSVFALVTGSQIGSGVFVIPASLAPYGMLGIAGWGISGLGALSLALVFAKLCSWFPQTGGPHVYTKEAFGNTAAFFTGWTYWIISWVSSTVLVTASIGFLAPLIGIMSPAINLTLQVILLAAITALNFRGVTSAGKAETVLTTLKFLPLVVVPICALYFFDAHNIALDPTLSMLSMSELLSRTTLVTLWGFIGLESATASAGAVKNPAKTIPRAVIWGTLCVAFLYVMNSYGIMGVLPSSVLMNSSAPYADAVHIMFGGNWHIVLSLVLSIICIGTLNAWTLTSSQIALGLAQDNFLPAYFLQKNKHGVPLWGLMASFVGLIPLLVLTTSASLAHQVTTIIEFSVTAFLFVYAVCSLAFLKICFTQRRGEWMGMLYGSCALLFCCWVIYQTPLATLLIASLFALSGIPFYLHARHSIHRSTR